MNHICRWIPKEKLRSGETPSSAFDALRRYLWKPTCKELAINSVRDRIRKKCSETLEDSYDKDVAIIFSTSTRITAMEKNAESGFNWFPDYWLTFQLASLPATNKCFTCFETDVLHGTPNVAVGRKQRRAHEERIIKKAKHCETPNTSTTNNSKNTPATPVNLDENKFEVTHIETENQKLQFKINVLTTKITNFEALNTDGSFNDRIREARLALMLLLDTTSASF
jgi:hypothetical protein